MRLEYSWDFKKLMQKVKNDVIQNWWSFAIQQNDEMAVWEIKISWVHVWFEILGKLIDIKVISKPFLVSTSFVEQKIKDLIKKYL